MVKRILFSATAETQGNNKPSEADVLAENGRLKTELQAERDKVASLSTERDGLKGEKTTFAGQVSTLTSERDTARTELATARGQVTSLTTERDTLRTENARLTESQKDFDKKMTAKLAEHGIREKAVIAATKPDGTKMTETERCAAARAK